MGRTWKVRGIRGATTVAANDAQQIVDAARELVLEMMARNDVDNEDIISVLFTTSPDLNAEFPAVGGRAAGLDNVPLVCASEIDVPRGLPRCIRVLMHINSTKSLAEISHVYMRDAVVLRPDLRKELKS